jgi:excisionase family DNA binding protein
MPAPPTKGALSIAEAAEYLSVGRTTVYCLLAAEELSCVYIGRRRLIPRSALDKFIERRQSEEESHVRG